MQQDVCYAQNRKLRIKVNYSCNKLHATRKDFIRIAYGFYSQTLAGYNKKICTLIPLIRWKVNPTFGVQIIDDAFLLALFFQMLNFLDHVRCGKTILKIQHFHLATVCPDFLTTGNVFRFIVAAFHQ